MNTSRVVIVLLFTSFSMAWMPVPAAAREVNSAAELLPDTTVLYVEAAQIKEDVSRVLNHPMRERIESLTVFQQQDVAENLVRLRAAISLFEAGMSMRLPVAIETIGHGGIFFAIDGDSSGIAILAKSKDAETADKLMDVVLSVVRTSHTGLSQAGRPDR